MHQKGVGGYIDAGEHREFSSSMHHSEQTALLQKQKVNSKLFKNLPNNGLMQQQMAHLGS